MSAEDNNNDSQDTQEISETNTRSHSSVHRTVQLNNATEIEANRKENIQVAPIVVLADEQMDKPMLFSTSHPSSVVGNTTALVPNSTNPNLLLAASNIGLNVANRRIAPGGDNRGTFQQGPSTSNGKTGQCKCGKRSKPKVQPAPPPITTSGRCQCGKGGSRDPSRSSNRPSNPNRAQCNCNLGEYLPRMPPPPPPPQYDGRKSGQCNCSAGPPRVQPQYVQPQNRGSKSNPGQCNCGMGRKSQSQYVPPVQMPERPSQMPERSSQMSERPSQMPEHSSQMSERPSQMTERPSQKADSIAQDGSAPIKPAGTCNCAYAQQARNLGSMDSQGANDPNSGQSQRPSALSPETNATNPPGGAPDDCSCPLNAFDDADCLDKNGDLRDSQGNVIPKALVGVLKLSNDDVSFSVWRTPHFIKIGGESEVLQTVRPQSGWAEQDPNQIVSQSIQVINKMCRRLEKDEIDLSEIKAMAILNEPDTFVTWDANSGQPLYNAILSEDKRSQPIVDELIKEYGENYFQKQTGLPIDTYFMGTKLRWLTENIMAVESAGRQGTLRIGTLESWMVWNLTQGDIHVTDCTNAARTMMMNIKSLRWESSLMKEFGAQESMLPEIHSNSEEYCRITDSNCMLFDVPICCLITIPNSKMVGTFALEAGTALTGNENETSFVMCNTGTSCVFDNNGLITTVAYQMGPDAEVYYALGGVVPSSKKLLNIVGQNPRAVPTQGHAIVNSPRQSGQSRQSRVSGRASAVQSAGDAASSERFSIAGAIRNSINRRLSSGPAFFATPRNSGVMPSGSIRNSIRSSVERSLGSNRLMPESNTPRNTIQVPPYQPSSAMFIPGSEKFYQPNVDLDNVGYFEDIDDQTTSQDIEHALIEAQEFQKTAMLESAESAGKPVKKLKASGELAEDEEMMQLEADITNVEVVKPRREDQDELGAAMLAAQGKELVRLTPNTLKEIEGETKSFHPHDSALRDRYKNWKNKAYGKSKSTVDCFTSRIPGFSILPFSLQQLLCGHINNDNIIWLEGLLALLLLLLGLLWLWRRSRPKPVAAVHRSCNCCRPRRKLM